MKENRINATIAFTCLIAALLMTAALSFSIGKWHLGNAGYKIIIRFPNATGIAPNSAVKYAGANAGVVREVRLLSREEQTIDPATKLVNCVEVVAEINSNIEIGDDVSAIIKQDGIGIAAKYVLLTPGPDRNSKALVDGSVVQGQMPFDLADLIQPAGQALEQAKELVTQLQPMVNRLDSMSQKLETDLPPLIDNANTFLQNGNTVMANFNTPEGRERLNVMLDSLRVSTENLKVVSSNAKALTATLADKPWRVFWGGSTFVAPPESTVLKSNKVIPLQPQVEVSGDSSKSANKKTVEQP